MTWGVTSTVAGAPSESGPRGTTLTFGQVVTSGGVSGSASAVLGALPPWAWVAVAALVVVVVRRGKVWGR